MNRIKTQDLTGAALDWAVAKCEGYVEEVEKSGWPWYPTAYNPSTDWSQGGEIVMRERIGIWAYEWDEDGNENPGWYAEDKGGDHVRTAPTPLVAAMRCFVASKLGDEVEIPEELQ